MKDGLLSIELIREIPEAMKPRKIDINAGENRTIEGRDEKKVQVEERKQEEEAPAT
jgi:molecular chaperone IbpA